MSQASDGYMNELAGNLYKLQDEQERLMASRSDTWWVKKHFGDHIKMTGNLIFAKTPEDFLKEIDRQNQKIMEEKK